MQSLNSILRAAIGLVVAAVIAQPLAGCGGTTPATPAANAALPAAVSALGSVATPETTPTPLLFVSDGTVAGDDVLVFNASPKRQNPPPIRKITKGIALPDGLATDKSGNLYVANSYNSTVTVYARNSSTPKKTISIGLKTPYDVKVDGFGNIYVANNPGGSETSFIVKYNAGQSTPSFTWTVPETGMVLTGIAILNPKQAGYQSIYALEYIMNTSFAHGGGLSCIPGNAVCSPLGATFGRTGGIAVAESPGLQKPFQWIAVDQYIPGIDIFTQGQMTQFATGGTPEFITLNAAGNDLFVVDGFSSKAIEYSYPGLKQVNIFTDPVGGNYDTFGVATDPSGTLH